MLWRGNGGKGARHEGSRHEGRKSATLSDVTVSEVMDRNVLSVSPDTTAEAVRDLLLDAGLSGVPVVDEDGLAGMVSKSDVLRRLQEEEWQDSVWNPECPFWLENPELPLWLDRTMCIEPRKLTVADVMTPFAFTLPADAPLSRACALMAYEGVQQLPVTADTNPIRLVGVVRTFHILRWVARTSGFIMPNCTQLERESWANRAGSAALRAGS